MKSIEKAEIRKFMEMAAEVAQSSKVLDVGAGNKPYKALFHRSVYASIDVQGDHNFIGSVMHMPLLDNHFNHVLCTQVLEHVTDPLKALEEICRVLKPGGILWMTVPQGWGVHGSPPSYFNFTRYGILELCRKAGFVNYNIMERGGILRDLGYRIYVLPGIIRAQHKKNLFVTLLYWFSIPFCKFIIPKLCYVFDFLDRDQDFTLGYNVMAVKAGGKE